MKVIKINKGLPSYTKGEEIFNMTSHIIGAVFGIFTLIICVIISSLHQNIYGIISSIIYGISMIILYTMSSIYHGLSPTITGKKVFRILDHCTIFLLIAGSYTPFALCLFREYDSTTGWILFSVIWMISILGICLNAINIEKYKKISMIFYIFLGWAGICKASLFSSLIGTMGLLLLVSGGISYTIGAILYGLGKRHKYIHSVFHLFVLLGTILQFFCIVIYVL